MLNETVFITIKGFCEKKIKTVKTTVLVGARSRFESDIIIELK